MDARLEKPPQVAEMDDELFARQFEDFVHRLAVECNWHEHTPMCFKHLSNGEQPSDSNCRMRIDGTVCMQTMLDPETEAICLRRLHPWINNYNDVVLFLMQCNMDIKFIGSGSAAKALTYYISDYITKNELKVHVGLQAIQAAMESHRKRFADDPTSSESTRERNLLMKTVNAMMGRREVSHQQVMSYLVGGGTTMQVTSFALSDSMSSLTLLLSMSAILILIAVARNTDLPIVLKICMAKLVWLLSPKAL